MASRMVTRDDTRTPAPANAPARSPRSRAVIGAGRSRIGRGATQILLEGPLPGACTPREQGVARTAIRARLEARTGHAPATTRCAARSRRSHAAQVPSVSRRWFRCAGVVADQRVATALAVGCRHACCAISAHRRAARCVDDRVQGADTVCTGRWRHAAGTGRAPIAGPAGMETARTRAPSYAGAAAIAGTAGSTPCRG
jgi:hypothetical protein